MNKLILAVSYFVICSYFSNPIQSAEASGRHSKAMKKTHSSSHHPTFQRASWYGADLHGLETGIKVNYQKISVETLAEEQPESFDHVT